MKKYLFLLFILLLTGCNRVEEDCPVTAEPTATPVTDFVWLEDVEPPVWNERFAVLKGAADSFVVDWGFSSGNFVMAESSGFPGFGKPILVIGEGCLVADNYSLQTSYGSWVYSVAGSREAVINDSGDNLIDKQTGEKIINFAVSDEVLHVYDRNKESVTIAYLSSGTEVIAGGLEGVSYVPNQRDSSWKYCAFP